MVLRATAFVLLTSLLIGPYAVCVATGGRGQRAIAKLWFDGCLGICGIRLTVKGLPSEAPGTLFVSNHVSYLDVLVLGAMTDARFVAKREVQGWPLFGMLARMANTVFVTRDWRAAQRDKGSLEAIIGAGGKLILFPEGTSSDGRGVLPFRTTLFAAVDPNRVAPEVQLQPVSIAYAGYADGRPLRGLLTDLYAWYGDMTLFGHLMTVFGLKGAKVEITFQPPIKPVAFPDRKSLAAAAERAVRNGLHASLGG